MNCKENNVILCHYCKINADFCHISQWISYFTIYNSISHLMEIFNKNPNINDNVWFMKSLRKYDISLYKRYMKAIILV